MALNNTANFIFDRVLTLAGSCTIEGTATNSIVYHLSSQRRTHGELPYKGGKVSLCLVLVYDPMTMKKIATSRVQEANHSRIQSPFTERIWNVFN
jgi:hypothetical protein